VKSECAKGKRANLALAMRFATAASRTWSSESIIPLDIE
jgi:hypothetical protein